MNYSNKAWLDINNPSWRIILPPSISVGNQSKIMPLSIGFYDKEYKAEIINKKNYNNRSFLPLPVTQKQGSIKLGPTLGIMATDGANGFRGNKKNFIDLIKMGIKLGVFTFVFTIESLDMQSKTVKGYLYSTNRKQWVVRQMPIPDVIYNRIANRKEEEKNIVVQHINYLKGEGVPLFNLKYFDKLTLNKWIKESDELASIIPETANFHRSILEKYLLKYSIIYLKPVHGKAGFDFIRVDKIDSNSYQVTHQTKRNRLVKNFNQLQLLSDFIASLTEGKEYAIQQGIDLKRYNGNTYDIRALVQKNKFGEWNLTGIGVRVAGAGSITTHVPQGGSIQSVDVVLRQSFGKKKDEWKLKIKMLVLKIATHLEKQAGYPLGEMSMDLGLDTNNKLWFFEANAKPMKFDEPTIRKKSLVRIMQYTRYLASKSSK